MSIDFFYIFIYLIRQQKKNKYSIKTHRSVSVFIYDLYLNGKNDNLYKYTLQRIQFSYKCALLKQKKR